MRNRRNFTLARQLSNYCSYCGIYLYDFQKHIDHFIPVSGCGGNTIDNLKVSCSRCNLIKSNFSFETMFDACKYILTKREEVEKTTFPFSPFIRTGISINIEKINSVLNNGIHEKQEEIIDDLLIEEQTKLCLICNNNFIINEVEGNYCSAYCAKEDLGGYLYEHYCKRCGKMIINKGKIRWCNDCKN